MTSTHKNIWIGLVLLFIAGGCASPLEKGWASYDKADYIKAEMEWQEKHPDLAQKAKAAHTVVVTREALKKVEKSSKYKTKVKLSQKIVDQDRFKTTDWLDRAPAVKTFIAEAKLIRSKAKAALEAIANRGKYQSYLKCGKSKYTQEKYEEALKCLNSAHVLTKTIKSLAKDREEVEYELATVNQAIQIQKDLEEERKRIIAERKRIDEENRIKAAAAIAAALAAQKAEEAERLRKKEEKRKKAIARKNRWKRFVKNGYPLTPLVARVGVPSKGKRKIGKNKTQKWQGGARYPKVKNKNLRPEDVYALEIVVPVGFKVNYLKNHGTKNKNENLIGNPAIQGKTKHFFSEGYKGGRYYTEVKHLQGNRSYKIKSVIYKTPVTD